MNFRPGGNVNRAWDLDELTWDANGNLDPQGPSRHRSSARRSSCTARTCSRSARRSAANFYAGSGTPLTTYVNTLNGIEVFVEGRGDMGRTDVLNYTDLLVSHGSCGWAALSACGSSSTC